MKYQIDQSGKIENTNVMTVLAVCNLGYSLEQTCRIINNTNKKEAPVSGSFFGVRSDSRSPDTRKRNLSQNMPIVNHVVWRRAGETISIPSLDRTFRVSSEFDNLVDSPSNHKNSISINPSTLAKMKYQEEILSKMKKTDGRLRECLSTLVSIQPRSKTGYYHHQTKKSRKQKYKQNVK